MCNIISNVTHECSFLFYFCISKIWWCRMTYDDILFEIPKNAYMMPYNAVLSLISMNCSFEWMIPYHDILWGSTPYCAALLFMILYCTIQTLVQFHPWEQKWRFTMLYNAVLCLIIANLPLSGQCHTMIYYEDQLHTMQHYHSQSCTVPYRH